MAQKKQAQEPQHDKGLHEKLEKEGFFDCKKVLLERDGAGNITGIKKVVREPKAQYQENIDTFNSQQHNSGMVLMKKNADYDLADVQVATNKDGSPITRKMYVEVEKKSKVTE